MNSYDAKHLHVLELISEHRFSDMTLDNIYELKVLIACKYVVRVQRPGQGASLILNPDGQHYHQRLAQLAARRVSLPG